MELHKRYDVSNRMDQKDQNDTYMSSLRIISIVNSSRPIAQRKIRGTEFKWQEKFTSEVSPFAQFT